MAIISSRAKMVGRYDRQVCSRSLVVFNPLVNLPPSRDDGAISTYYLRKDPVPGFFCFDLSLILLSLLMRAPDCHTNLTHSTLKTKWQAF